MDSPPTGSNPPYDKMPGGNIRIGCGFDIHALVQGRPLILGGVRIPHSHGLAGHSDADVLLHAIIDALLGALAWGDIGRWFPDSDSAYRDADSRELFRIVWQKCTGENWRLVNCDCVLIAEEPRLAPHIPEIRLSIAELFSANTTQISIKAKTMEHLGALGRGEGIAANVVLLLEQTS